MHDAGRLSRTTSRRCGQDGGNRRRQFCEAGTRIPISAAAQKLAGRTFSSGRVSLAEAVVHSLGDRVSLLPLAIGGPAAASRARNNPRLGHRRRPALPLRHCAVRSWRRRLSAARTDRALRHPAVPSRWRPGRLGPRRRGRSTATAATVSSRLATICLGVVENHLAPPNHHREPTCTSTTGNSTRNRLNRVATHKRSIGTPRFNRRSTSFVTRSRTASPRGLVAGPAGVGKTLLIETLRQQIGETYQPFVRVVFPQMTDRDLLVYLAEQLDSPPADPPRYTIEESLRRLEYILCHNVARKRHAMIVVDEAHLLEDSGLLEPLRLLLNPRHCALAVHIAPSRPTDARSNGAASWRTRRAR